MFSGASTGSSGMGDRGTTGAASIVHRAAISAPTAITDVEGADANIASNIRPADGAVNAARAYRINEKTALAELATEECVSNNQAPPHRIRFRIRAVKVGCRKRISSPAAPL